MEDIVKNKNIHYLYHFTKLDNIPSILEKGLLTNEYMKLHNIFFSSNDPLRLDKRLNTISCSIMWPNYRMFFSLRQSNLHQQYVLIRLKASILYELPCLFFTTNAANSVFADVPDESLSGAEAFLKLFDNKINNYVRISKTHDFWPTDPQAEILVRANIPANYIADILCEKDENLQACSGMCANSHVQCYVNEFYFKYRADHRENNIQKNEQ